MKYIVVGEPLLDIAEVGHDVRAHRPAGSAQGLDGFDQRAAGIDAAGDLGRVGAEMVGQNAGATGPDGGRTLGCARPS